MKKAYRIPEASRTAKGTNIVNVLELQKDEKVTAMISVPQFDPDHYLTMITKNGVIKRTGLSEFTYQRKGGKRAITLDEGDELLFVRHTEGNENLIIASHLGNATRFEESEVRPMGRTARGVRAMRLSEDDFIVGVAVVDESKTLLTVTEGGLAKRTLFSDFRLMKHRGGSGIIAHKITEKSGPLCGIATVSEDDDIMLITNEGTIIRTAVNSINIYSRSAAGVIVMRLDEGAKIYNFTRLEKDEEIEEETKNKEEEIVNNPVVMDEEIEGEDEISESDENPVVENDTEEPVGDEE